MPSKTPKVPNKFPPKCLPLCKNQSSFGLFRLKKPPSIVDEMPIGTPQGNLDIKNATLRTSNLETQNIKIGSIFVGTGNSLEETANVGNTTSNTIQFTNTHTAFTTTGNVSVGGVTSTTSLMSNVVTIGTTKTFVVKVGSNGKYEIDGVDRPTLQLHQHQTYIFDLSDSSLTGSPGHPFVFDSSNSNDGTTNSDPYYTTGITTTGAYGSTEKRTFVVPAGAPTTLYYYCTQHPGMGATVSISPTAELIVSGRVESADLAVTGTSGISIGSGTTAQRPANPTLGTIRYNTETGYMEAYTVSGWASIAQPPTITGLSPLTIFDASTQVFTATGTGIVSGSTVQLEGADGSLYSVVDATAPNAAGTQVTFKMGGSEVVEFPPSGMSTNTSITGYVASSSESSSGSYNYLAWKAFDDVVSTGDYWPGYGGNADVGYSTSSPFLAGSSAPSTGQHNGHWLQLQIPSPVILSRAVIGTTSSGYQHGQFVILGSNNGTNWTLLHAGTGTTLSTNVTTLSEGVTTTFTYFRVVIKSKTSSTSGYNIELNNVQFFGKTGSWDLAQQPYKVRINSTSGLIGTSTAQIAFPVVWTTAAGTALNFDISGSVTQTLVGTDGGGGTNRTFSLAPGSNALPSGLTLTESGVISGIIAAEGTTSVTFRLTDNGSGLFTDRAINIMGTDGHYTFYTHTFTPAGATGRGGPTLTEARNAYSISVPPSPATPWDEDTNLFNILSTEKGIQRWTVPKTGSYTIDAYGARGCFDPSAVSGKGARIKGTFNLTKNQVIKIAVGQEGWMGSGAMRNRPGGGGGTFVWIDDPPNNPLIVAGGGGGVHVNFTTDADGQSGTSAGIASSGGFTTQRGYPGQVVGVGHGSWINASGYACCGGGAGWLSEGHDSTYSYGTAYAGTNGSYWKQSTTQCCKIGTFGRDLRLASGMRVSDFANTGSGQNHNNPVDGILVNTVNEKLYGGFQGCYGNETHSVGGFGGGGGGGSGGEGGGGGYTGGAGTYSSHNHGGGGGSYNGGSSQTNTAGSMNGNGSCIITYNS